MVEPEETEKEDRILPQPILDHMPPLVQKQIVGYCNTGSKVALRICSKSLRFHANKSEVVYDKLIVALEQDSIMIRLLFDDSMENTMEFRKNGEGYLMVSEQHNWSKSVDNGHFVEGAVKFLFKILKIRNALFIKLHLILSKVGENDGLKESKNTFLMKLQEKLQELTHKIRVKSFEFGHHKDAQLIIPYLEPKTLKVMLLRFMSGTTIVSSDFLGVATLPQIPFLKRLLMKGFQTDRFYKVFAKIRFVAIEIRVLKLSHIKREIESFQTTTKRKYLRYWYARVENVREIKDYFMEFEKLNDRNLCRKVPGLGRDLKVSLTRTTFTITELRAPSVPQPPLPQPQQ